MVMGLTNIMLSIPSLVFALAIMAVLGPGLINIFLALGLTNWAYSCRITRSQVLFTRSLDYVVAARALGYGEARIMFTQILPNILGPILVVATLGSGRGDSHRGGSLLSRPGHPASDSQLGRNAFHGPGTTLHRPLDLHIPGSGHLYHRARAEPPGRRFEGHPRPTYHPSEKVNGNA